MVKAKFGPAVRAKDPAAMVNEVLLTLLCHDIAVLAQAFYDLGVDPVLSLQQPETFESKNAAWLKSRVKSRFLSQSQLV